MTQTAPRPARQDAVEVPREALRAALPLLREIGDLKRVRTAEHGGTDGADVAAGALRAAEGGGTSADGQRAGSGGAGADGRPTGSGAVAGGRTADARGTDADGRMTGSGADGGGRTTGSGGVGVGGRTTDARGTDGGGRTEADGRTVGGRTVGGRTVGGRMVGGGRADGGGGSVAERAFLSAWARLAGGGDPGDVGVRTCAAAVAGARLAGVDGPVLRRCGLTADEAVAVLRRSVAQHAHRVGPRTSALLREALPSLAEDVYGAYDGPVPEFATALCAQPRAGATCPGQPRLMVEPPESHGDHCWAVAVYGVLLAEAFGADPGDVFLLGLGHHLHNAVLPDAGFSGEELLGDQLPVVVARLTREQLAVLPGPLAARLGSLLALREAADAPAARAFHAADVLDRVLQVRHHARAAAFTAEQALDDLDLVHPCAVSGFHRAVLDAAEAV